MATLTVRRIDDATKALLKKRASRNGRSMEEEARDILASALKPKSGKKGLGSAITDIFRPIGGGELEPFPKSRVRPPPDFSDW